MNVTSLAEQLFFTTVRLDTVTDTGAQGCGTGFLYAQKHGDQTFPFVVTNKHVVRGMKAGWLNFLQRDGDKPKLGSAFRLEIQGWPDAWFDHPSPDVDIAICPFVPLESHIKQQSNVDLFYRFVGSETIPSQAELDNIDALESVTFIGYPNGIWDRSNFLPVARRGMTAMPLIVDFENTPRFLIDASVFGGSSGSPVFLLNQGAYSGKSGMTIGSRCFFVGVIASVFFRRQFNQIVAVPIPTHAQPMVEQQEMIDLGIVFKARTVVETVEAYLKAKNIIVQTAVI
jgi:hypothetical protein